MNCRSERLKRAFTLVELLVVISIIALLLAMLMPALKRARDKAAQVKCLTSMKDIAYAEQMYAMDNKELYPNALDCLQLGGSFSFRAAPGYRDPADPRGLYERYGLAAVLGQVDYYGKSPKGAYLDAHSKVWVCPVQPSWMKKLGVTYAYNSNSGVSATLRKYKTFQITTKLGSTEPLIWENFNFLPYTPGTPVTGSSSKFNVDPGKIVYPHNFAKKKTQAVNYLFADLHVAQLWSNKK